MEKIVTPLKMSKINDNTMSFEILLSAKFNGFRARSSCLSKINNIKDLRPEAFSKYSYEDAIQKLIPKLQSALLGTNKKLGAIFQDKNGKVFFSIENKLYETPQVVSSNADSLASVLSQFVETIKSLTALDVNTVNVHNLPTNLCSKQDINSENKENIISFKDVTIEWLQSLLVRTKKKYEDDEYLSPTTLESYSRNIRNILFPYLEDYPEINNINLFSEKNVDEVLSLTPCLDTKRVLLLSLKLIFEFAKEKSYIKSNLIANKKNVNTKKTKKKQKQESNEYEFIEEEERALWINCMLKEFHSQEFENTDAPLAFLFMLLHGPRPEETCGVRWIDLNFEEDDYHVQNAYKNIPIYDPISMKRIGWKKENGPLKTPESYRHLSLDLLAKQLLLEHRIKQMHQFRKARKKWSENEYVFLNSTGTPFTSDILSKNFTKFVRRNKLSHMVLYGLRHSFATHCRNLGMESEILAKLMGHTEYETTQKYYIHVSRKQKKDELQKVQKKDMQNYLGKENKHLEHLQNNIMQYNKNISNLQEVQKEDMTYYSKLDDKTLDILKDFIKKIYQKEKLTA